MSNVDAQDHSAVPLVSKEAADALWRCFLENEDAYFEMPNVELLDSLNLLMEVYAPGVAMEVSGDNDDSERHLILTAHGDKGQFLSLRTLHHAAPNLKRFSTVTAFRQRALHPEFGINMDGMELLAQDIQVGLFSDGGLVGLELAFSNAISLDRIELAQHIAFILLDHVIGEYDFAVRVGFVEFADQVSASAERTCALNKLPETFDLFLRDSLGHTWEWPGNGEKEHWVMLMVPSEEEDGRPNIVSVRHDANTVALRADFSHCLDVSVDVRDQDSVERARDLQETLRQVLEADRSAILVLTMVMMDEGRRICRFYLDDPSAWTEEVREVSQRHGFDAPNMEITFDPSWDGYFEFKR